MSDIIIKCKCGRLVELTKLTNDTYECPHCKKIIYKIFDGITESYEFYYKEELE